MAERYPQVLFLKIEIDENKAAAERYEITRMPTFLFIKDGEVVHSFSGASEANLETAVSELASESSITDE